MAYNQVHYFRVNHLAVMFLKQTCKNHCTVNYQLSIRINDRHGSMRIDNGYYNKDYGLLAR